jgi:hypothetical protein
MSYVNYLDGSTLCNLREGGAGVCGGFKINDTEGQILFDSNFSESQIVLEYIASPTVGEDIMLPIQVQEALIAWLAWKDIQSLPSSRKVTASEKMMRRREWFNEKRNARIRSKPYRLSETNPVRKLVFSSAASNSSGVDVTDSWGTVNW